MVRRLLFIVLVVVPLIEIGLFVVIGQAIGVLPTLLGVVIAAIAGALVIRWQGISVLRDMQATLQRGEVPARQIGDAMLIGLGGLLLMLPGYLSDLIGILLLVPAVRHLIYRGLAGRFQIVPAAPPPPADPQLLDLDSSSWRDR